MGRAGSQTGLRERLQTTAASVKQACHITPKLTTPSFFFLISSDLIPCIQRCKHGLDQSEINLSHQHSSLFFGQELVVMPAFCLCFKAINEIRNVKHSI